MPALGVKITGDTSNVDAAFNRVSVMAKKLAAEQARLGNSLFHAEQSRSPGQVHEITQKLEKNRIAMDALTRAHLAENAAIEAKVQAYKKLQGAAFAAQGQKLNASSGFLTHVGFEQGVPASEKIRRYQGAKKNIMGGGETNFLKFDALQRGITGGIAYESGAKVANGWLKGFSAKLSGTGSGGMSQLVSVVSNTMSSLASGISPARVIAQQGPNVVQAFTLMSQNALATMVKFLFNPLTWAITAGVAAVAGGAYLIYNYFDRLGAGLENISNKYGLASPKAAQLNDEFVKGRTAAAQFNRELRNMGGEILSIAQKTDNLLKKMREKFALETEYAKSRGVSGRRLYEMELEELRKEQDVINRARELAYEKKAQHKKEAAEALKTLNSPENAAERVRGQTALSEADFYAKAVDEMVKKNPYLASIRGEVAKGNGAGTFTAREVIGQGANGEDISTEVTRTYAEELERLSNTVVDLEVGGRKFHGSLADAVREQDGYNALAAKLKQTQDDLQSIYEKKTALTKADVESIKSLAKQESEIINAINLKSSDKARALAMGGAVSQDLSANQRIGAFAMPMQTTLIDLSRQQLQQQTKFNVNLEKLLAKPDSGVTPAMVNAMINGPFQ